MSRSSRSAHSAQRDGTGIDGIVIEIRHATPYHLPLFIAQSLGFYKEEGIEVAILAPSDPSDVTEMIGSLKIDMGAKVRLIVSWRRTELTRDVMHRPWFTRSRVKLEDSPSNRSEL